MRTWKTIMALVVCLSLLTAGAALAKKCEKQTKIMCASSGDEKEMKVEIVEEDGKAHVKIWHVEDGKEVLVEEFDAAADDERVLKLDGEHMIMIMGDNGDVMFHGDGDEDFVFVTGDDDMTWFGDGGAYLGVHLSDLSDDQAEYFEVKNGEGALITDVVDESPAAEAGFRIYDIITKIDDMNIEDADDAVSAVRDHEKGDEVKVTVLRKGKKKTLKATLDEQDTHAFALGGSHAPNRLWKRFHDVDGHGKSMKLHRNFLTPSTTPDHHELENLRADVEELRAMLDELKADKN